jgi:hypothetical protein
LTKYSSTRTGTRLCGRNAAVPHPPFPYGIFYVPAGNELRVTAIYHLARDPKGWQGRS